MAIWENRARAGCRSAGPRPMRDVFQTLCRAAGLALPAPEVVESLFVLWRITKNTKYRRWGYEIALNIEKHARIPSGVSEATNTPWLRSMTTDGSLPRRATQSAIALRTWMHSV